MQCWHRSVATAVVGTALWAAGAQAAVIQSNYTVPLTVVPGQTIALYHLNEASGTTMADATGVNNGTHTNATIVSGQTGFGNAVSYNGTTTSYYSSAPDSTSFDSLNNGTQMTVEFWVKIPDATLTTSQFVGLVSKGNDVGGVLSTSDTWGVYLRGTGSAISSSVQIVWRIGNKDVIGTTAFPVNQWVHVTANYNEDVEVKQADLYLNTTNLNTVGANLSTTTNQIPANDQTFHIGSAEIKPSAISGVVIDEVRISNVAMVPTTVPEPTAATTSLLMGGALLARRRRMTRK